MPPIWLRCLGRGECARDPLQRACHIGYHRRPSVWYVEDDGDTENGCTSWEDACSDLQTALGLVNSGDEIRVAQGTYRADATLILGPKMRRDRVVILID